MNLSKLLLIAALTPALAPQTPVPPNRNQNQDPSWQSRKRSFQKLTKSADPRDAATRNSIFVLLAREHSQLRAWIGAGQAPPESWVEEYYPYVLEYIERHYMPTLKDAEFRILVRASMNHDSPFARSLSRHAGRNLDWLAATVATEKNENFRVNMTALAANWLLSAPDAGAAQKKIVHEILRRGTKDKSPIVASYSTRTLRSHPRLDTKPSPYP